MGVNIRLYLYRSADPREVAQAMAILSGNEPKPEFIPRSGGFGQNKPAPPPYYEGARPDNGFWVARPKVELTASDTFFGMGTIRFDSPVDPHNEGHFTHVHAGEYRGFGWLLEPPSTPYWIAVCRRIADLFGGALDYNDCDLSEADYFRFERDWADDKDGNGYLARQDAILALKPLTAGEIEACREFAAYRDMGSYDAATA